MNRNPARLCASRLGLRLLQPTCECPTGIGFFCGHVYVIAITHFEFLQPIGSEKVT